MKNIINNNTKKGFSLLFAVLTGSLVLSIALALLSITLKQITLASAGKESQAAFYVADTGMECAMYLDRGGGNNACPQGIFSIPFLMMDGTANSRNCDPDFDGPDDLGAPIYQCAGVYFVDATVYTSGSGFGVIQKYAPYVDGSGVVYADTGLSIPSSVDDICFNALITKRQNLDTTIETRIISRGYSTCNTSATNRFERALRVRY